MAAPAPAPPAARAAWRPGWPLALAVLLLAAGCAVTWRDVMRAQDGQFTYVIDDAYIYLAYARNLAENGLWGVTPWDTASAASTILWPIVLAGAHVVSGGHLLSAFALNVLLAVGILVLVSYLCHREGLGPRATFLLLAGVGLATPFVPMIFLGMEPLLQSLVVLGLLYVGAVNVSSPTPSRASWWGLFLLAPLAVATRYEDAFAVGAVALALFARGRRWQAVALLGAGALPALVYGLLATWGGWLFMPNSIVVKRLATDAAKAGAIHIQYLLTSAGILTFLAAGTWWLRFRTDRNPWDRRGVLLATFVPTALGQLLLGSIGWFHRYEAYLMCAGVFAVGLALHGLLPRDARPWRERRPMVLAAWGVALLLVAVPVANRAVATWPTTQPHATAVYQLQLQEGIFVQRYFPEATVGMLDIGAIAYEAPRVRILDFNGLATREMGLAYLNGTANTETVRALAETYDADIVVAVDPWAGNTSWPAEWARVGEWVIPRSFSGGPKMSWFAADPAQEAYLRASLDEYEKELPPGVVYNRFT